LGVELELSTPAPIDLQTSVAGSLIAAPPARPWPCDVSYWVFQEPGCPGTRRPAVPSLVQSSSVALCTFMGSHQKTQRVQKKFNVCNRTDIQAYFGDATA
jgi:hypothetical protein